MEAAKEGRRFPMPIDTSSMDEKARKKFENLTWTAMRYMRDKGLAEANAKITHVTEATPTPDGNIQIAFRISWVDRKNNVRAREVRLWRHDLLAYYDSILRAVGAEANPDKPFGDASEVSPPVSIPTSRPATKPASPKQRPIVSVPVTTWATERTKLTDLSGRTLRPKDGRLSCNCTMSVRPGATTCQHVRWGYLTGKDNDIEGYRHLLDRPAIHQILSVPIGMGHYWTKVTMMLTPDKRHFAIVSGLDATLCRGMGWTSDGFFLELDEGLMGYIQYLEDLLEQVAQFTRPWEVLEVTPSAFNPDIIGCSIRHGTTQRSAIIAATRPSNPDRRNWLLANAAQIIETDGKTCLACAKLEVGLNDVPDI
jgi:hypothetical protein